MLSSRPATSELLRAAKTRKLFYVCLKMKKDSKRRNKQTKNFAPYKLVIGRGNYKKLQKSSRRNFDCRSVGNRQGLASPKPARKHRDTLDKCKRKRSEQQRYFSPLGGTAINERFTRSIRMKQVSSVQGTCIKQHCK